VGGSDVKVFDLDGFVVVGGVFVVEAALCVG